METWSEVSERYFWLFKNELCTVGVLQQGEHLVLGESFQESKRNGMYHSGIKVDDERKTLEIFLSDKGKLKYKITWSRQKSCGVVAKPQQKLA